LNTPNPPSRYATASVRVLKRENGVLHAFSSHGVFNERIMGRTSLPACHKILHVVRLHFIEKDE